MFENKHTFYNFMRNVAECTKEGGYFIGTCFDGKAIFNRLRSRAQGDGDVIYNNEKKVWSLTKDYDAISFEDNISSLGYKISVYQESINQTIPEYLVNFDFLVETMSNYGFRLLPRDDAKKIGLPEGSGMFVEMYNKMMDDIRRNPKLEKEYGMAPFMTDYEKRISFLNRYFIFQKIATRNVEKLTRSILENVPDEYEFEDRQSAIAEKVVQKVNEEIKPKVKNLRKKLKLQEATEVQEEQAKLKEVADVAIVEGAAVEGAAVEGAAVHVLENKKVVKPKKTKKNVEFVEAAADKPEKAKEKNKTTRKKKTRL
jgi:hypothetical protein